MAEVTHENVQPLIESAKQEGSTMRCTFKCPVSGTKVEAQAAIQKGRGLADVAKRSAKRSLTSRIRWGISRLVRSALGHGIAGRIAGDVAGSAVSEAARTTDQSFSEDEKQAAVVQAFENVQSQFVWDAGRNTWVSAKAAAGVLTDFARQLNEASVSQKYDQGVLARMLVEVANADGNLAAEEKDFLAGFIPSELGTVGELASRDRLSAAELAETSPGGVRDTMLMIAWGLALTDKDLAEPESKRLAELAQGLEISEERADEMKFFAQQFVVDQAMENVYPGGSINKAAQTETYQFAERIGLGRSEVERVEIRYRKRNGLV